VSAVVRALLPRALGSIDAWAAPVASVLGWAGAVSLVIGAINLLPAFPLDGGRVLRAALRARTGTIFDATDHVARVGAALGWTAGLAGAIVLLAADPGRPAPGVVAGVACMLIGWLLLLSAVRAADQVAVEKLMSTTPVRCAARRMLPPITPDTTIEDFVRDCTLVFDQTVVPVVQQGTLLGIVAPSGLRRAVGLDWMRTSVQAIMTPLESVVQTDPRVTLLQAWVALEGSGLQQVAVVEHGAMVGILHRDDIIDWVMEHREAE
jgi:CBS domain-containing protein